jgi:hypothetical protein
MLLLIYPCLVTGRWSSLVTPVSSTNKTDLYDIIEILLKVALSTITLTHIYVVFFMRIIDMSMCKSGQIKINIKWHKQWQNGQFYLKNINVSWSTGVGVDHKGGHVLAVDQKVGGQVLWVDRIVRRVQIFITVKQRKNEVFGFQSILDEIFDLLPC